MIDMKWTPAMSVGDEELDAQHRKLLGIIERLVDLNPGPLEAGAALEILRELVDYSDYHFRTEDDYMLDHQYPLFQSHRKEHLAYIKKMGALIETLEKKDASLTEEILKFLCQWWNTHITDSDQKYGRYIKAQKKKNTS